MLVVDEHFSAFEGLHTNTNGVLYVNGKCYSMFKTQCYRYLPKTTCNSWNCVSAIAIVDTTIIKYSITLLVKLYYSNIYQTQHDITFFTLLHFVVSSHNCLKLNFSVVFHVFFVTSGCCCCWHVHCRSVPHSLTCSW